MDLLTLIRQTNVGNSTSTTNTRTVVTATTVATIVGSAAPTWKEENYRDHVYCMIHVHMTAAILGDEAVVGIDMRLDTGCDTGLDAVAGCTGLELVRETALDSVKGVCGSADLITRDHIHVDGNASLPSIVKQPNNSIFQQKSTFKICLSPS